MASVPSVNPEVSPGFQTYAEWYTLRDELAPWIGERAVTLFSYAISHENECLVCTVYLRRILIDAGEDPDTPEVTEAEQLLLDWGRLIARTPGAIPAEISARVEATFKPTVRGLILAFAGQMVATNVFATASRIPLDESLLRYRKPGDERTN